MSAPRLQREPAEPKETPHIQALADAEVGEHDARRHAEEYRGLLGRVLEEGEDLHPQLREASWGQGLELFRARPAQL